MREQMETGRLLGEHKEMVPLNMTGCALSTPAAEPWPSFSGGFEGGGGSSGDSDGELLPSVRGSEDLVGLVPLPCCPKAGAQRVGKYSAARRTGFRGCLCQDLGLFWF